MNIIDSIMNNQIYGGNELNSNKLEKDGYTGTAQDLKDEIDLKADLVNGKVPLSQMDDSLVGAVEYKGAWGANTNTPTLPSTPTKKGIYYVVSTAGTQFGLTFGVGDWIISNGTIWQKLDATAQILADAVLTGNPTAPTPNLSDSDTSIATTAFVKGVAGNKYTFDTVEDMQSANYLQVLDITETFGYFEKGDGANEKYTINSSDLGYGISISGGLYANPLKEIENFEINGSIVEVGKIVNKKEEINFIEELKNIKPITKQVEVFDLNKGVTVMDIYGNGKFIKHYLVRLADDYITCSTCTSGDWKKTSTNEDGDYYNETTRTGVWVNSTTSINGYTSEIGATMTSTFSVSEKNKNINFRHQSRNDGGDFKCEIKLNGFLIKTTVISTYNETSIKEIEILLEDAPLGFYEIKLTFIGNGTKGWATSLKDFIIYNSDIKYSELNFLYLATPSNKDFAYEIKPTLESKYEFVPTHNGIVTVYKKTDPVFYIDDNIITDFTLGKIYVCSDFKLLQECYFRHPATGTTNLGEFRVMTAINESGILKYNGYFKPYSELYFKNSYNIMGVFRTEICGFLRTGAYNDVEIEGVAYNTNIFLEEESDITTNYMFFGNSSNKSLGLAYKINNPRKTLRRYKKDKKSIKGTTYLQIRDKNISKIYTSLFNSDILTSEYLTFDGEYKYINHEIVSILRGRL